MYDIMYNKEGLIAIADYLETPSTSKTNDENCRKDLYERFGMTSAKNKYLSGPLGENIVELYCNVINQYFSLKPNPIACEDSARKYSIRPDGEIFETCPDGKISDSFFVEVKMRAYHSGGTSHEKIPGIPLKYSNVGKKVKLFLLADDEHRYNRHYTRVLREEIKPENDAERYYKLAADEVYDEVILGTEVAKALRKHAETIS